MTLSLTQMSATDRAPLVSAAAMKALESLPIDARISETNIYDLLTTSASTYGDAPFLTFLPSGLSTDTPLTLSFQECSARVTQIANMFAAMGVTRTCGIGFLTPNLPDTYTSLLAAQTAGIANPVNPLLSVEHIANIMSAARVKIIVTASAAADADLFEKAKAVAALLPQTPKLITLDAPQDGADFLPSLIKAHPATELIGISPAASTDVAAAFHTGGTTSAPKLVQITHANQLATTCMGLLGSGYEEGDVGLAALPSYHVIAGIATPLVALAGGMNMLLCGPLGFRNPYFIMDFWKIIEQYKVTSAAVVPTVLSALSNLPVNADISSLKTFMCGAAPLPKALLADYEAKGITIVETYGMTEATTFCARNPVAGEKRAGSVGPPVAYQEMRIATRDDAGAWIDVQEGHIGTLIIRGPNVVTTTTYQDAEGHQLGDERVDEDGWLDTGDLGRFDEDGYLWLQGRAKDLIIRSGHNIDPRMIEEALSAHPETALVAAVGEPNAYAGEVPIAYVTLTKKNAVTADELLDYVREHVSERPAAPARIEIVSDMPLTTVGKIYKPALRVRAAEHVVESIIKSALEPSCDVQVMADEAAPGARRTVTISVQGLETDKQDVFLHAQADALSKLNLEPTFNMETPDAR